MKKTYISPSVEIEEIIMNRNACDLVVGSGGDGTAGEEADVKADNEDWNIWNED